MRSSKAGPIRIEGFQCCNKLALSRRMSWFVCSDGTWKTPQLEVWFVCSDGTRKPPQMEVCFVCEVFIFISRGHVCCIF